MPGARRPRSTGAATEADCGAEAKWQTEPSESSDGMGSGAVCRPLPVCRMLLALLSLFALGCGAARWVGVGHWALFAR